MTPTALSQIVEQTAKLSLGLCLQFIFSDVLMTVMGAIAAVTVSEIVALFALVAIYFLRKRKGITAQAAHTENLKSKDVAKNPAALCSDYSVGSDTSFHAAY